MASFDEVWRQAPGDMALPRDEVHIWRASLHQPPAYVQQLSQTLSFDEQGRANRFRFERDRQHFIVGRGVLRALLGRYAGLEPGVLHYRNGTHGKPALVNTYGGEGETLRFNMAHSHGYVLYGIAYEREIGVDIELMRPIEDAEQIVERFFSLREKEMFLALPAHEKQKVFYQWWTRKEAYLKATGDGLSSSLNQVEVALAPGETFRSLDIAGDEAESSRWVLCDLAPTPSYAAALVTEGDDWHLQYWQWPV